MTNPFKRFSMFLGLLAVVALASGCKHSVCVTYVDGKPKALVSDMPWSNGNPLSVREDMNAQCFEDEEVFDNERSKYAANEMVQLRFYELYPNPSGDKNAPIMELINSTTPLPGTRDVQEFSSALNNKAIILTPKGYLYPDNKIDISWVNAPGTNVKDYTLILYKKVDGQYIKIKGLKGSNAIGNIVLSPNEQVFYLYYDSICQIKDAEFKFVLRTNFKDGTKKSNVKEIKIDASRSNCK